VDCHDIDKPKKEKMDVDAAEVNILRTQYGEYMWTELDFVHLRVEKDAVERWKSKSNSSNEKQRPIGIKTA
jgi:hypothetical protein